PRQVEERVAPVGEAPVVPARHEARGGVQIAGAPVVPEPRPGGEDRLQARRGQPADGREPPQEPGVVPDDPPDRRLLHHDLGGPDAVRGSPPGPGKIAGMGPEPAPQRTEDRRGGEGSGGSGPAHGTIIYNDQAMRQTGSQEAPSGGTGEERDPSAAKPRTP